MAYSVVGHSWLRVPGVGGLAQYAVRVAQPGGKAKMEIEQLHRISPDGWICWSCLGFRCVAEQRPAEWWIRCLDCNSVSELDIDFQDGPSVEELEAEIEAEYNAALESEGSLEDEEDEEEDDDEEYEDD